MACWVDTIRKQVVDRRAASAVRPLLERKDNKAIILKATLFLTSDDGRMHFEIYFDDDAILATSTISQKPCQTNDLLAIETERNETLFPTEVTRCAWRLGILKRILCILNLDMGNWSMCDRTHVPCLISTKLNGIVSQHEIFMDEPNEHAPSSKDKRGCQPQKCEKPTPHELCLAAS